MHDLEMSAYLDKYAACHEKNAFWGLIFVYHTRRVTISSMTEGFTVVVSTHALESISYIHLSFFFFFS